MRGVRGIFAGVLGLTLLEVVVRSDANAQRAGNLIGDVAGVVARIVSPFVAAIPDRRKPSDAGQGGYNFKIPIPGLPDPTLHIPRISTRQPADPKPPATTISA